MTKRGVRVSVEGEESSAGGKKEKKEGRKMQNKRDIFGGVEYFFVGDGT